MVLPEESNNVFVQMDLRKLVKSGSLVHKTGGFETVISLVTMTNSLD